MGDGLEIGHSGVIGVDTESLRAAAVAWSALARTAEAAMFDAVVAGSAASSAGASQCATQCAQASGAAADLSVQSRAIAAGLGRSADLYEMAELLATQSASGADPTAAARFAELTARNPGAALALALLLRSLPSHFGQGFRDQMSRTFRFDPLFLLITERMISQVRRLDAGAFGADARLRSPDVPTEVIAMDATMYDQAPNGIADAVARIPDGNGDARVRVEKYVMADGAETFVVYVSGTVPGAEQDAFGVMDNLPLYLGLGGAGYSAVTKALEQAGAKPGATVMQVAYSQGAMVANRLSVEGRYDVTMQVTLGSPVVADLPADTLNVDIHHDNDFIGSVLRSEDLVGGQRNPGSIEVTRMIDAQPGKTLGLPVLDVQGAFLEPHMFEHYLETARMADADADPRLDAVRDHFAALDGAERVEVFEFAAREPDPPQRTGDPPDHGPDEPPARAGGRGDGSDGDGSPDGP